MSDHRGRGLPVLLLAGLLLSAVRPPAAEAMCCLCRNCGGAAFCVDGAGSALACATFCVEAGCASTVFDNADSCQDGCDGAPDAPTATPSGTPTETPTASPSATATATATASPTATASATTTPSDTETATATATETATADPSHTPSSTPTITETPTPSPTPALGGAIRYYAADLPVQGVTAAVLGDAPASTLSDAAGHYGFSSAGPGTIAVRPQKQGDFNAAVTSLDAVYVLQLVAGLRTFTADQRLAADVTGNGTVSSFDAALMLQFQAGLITRFDAANLCGSDWLFRPDPDPAQNQSLVSPQVADFVCQPGRINYSPVVPPATGQDFVAILLGDCTGNWTPAAE